VKKITELDKEIRIIEAKKAGTVPPTLREVLLTEISLETGIKGPQAIRLTRLGLNIMDAKDDIEIEDADFELLREVLKNPKHVRGIPVGFPSAIIGAVEMRLEEIK